MKLIDSHAHLDLPDFTSDLDDVLKRAADAGIEKMITIGIDLPSSRKAVALADAHNNIYATVGIHPCDSATATDEALAEIARLAASSKVVAIGETGLDFYHKPLSETNQLQALRFQLDLAAAINLPVVIHSRQSDAVVVPILIDWAKANPSHPKGVIHCFNSGIDVAKQYLEAGFHIALGGYVTYPSAKKSHDVFRYIPLDRLLLETDCPFLPPQNHRGQRNEPSYLVQTAEALATIRKIPVEELARAMVGNTKRLFGLT